MYMEQENERFIADLKKEAESYGAELSVDYFIDVKHLIHYWYGGDVAEIKYKGYTLAICANGDVVADLSDANGDEITRVKDKGNNGVFYDEMRAYISGDAQLRKLISEERLMFDYNNWWECFVTTPSGQDIDAMWDMDAYTMDEAIKEVLEEMDQVIESLESDT